MRRMLAFWRHGATRSVGVTFFRPPPSSVGLGRRSGLGGGEGSAASGFVPSRVLLRAWLAPHAAKDARKSLVLAAQLAAVRKPGGVVHPGEVGWDRRARRARRCLRRRLGVDARDGGEEGLGGVDAHWRADHGRCGRNLGVRGIEEALDGKGAADVRSTHLPRELACAEGDARAVRRGGARAEARDQKELGHRVACRWRERRQASERAADTGGWRGGRVARAALPNDAGRGGGQSPGRAPAAPVGV